MTILSQSAPTRNGDLNKQGPSHSVWNPGGIAADDRLNGQAEADIVRWLELLTEKGQVTELRALNGVSGSRKVSMSGYFDTDHLQEMATEALRLTHDAEGV